MKWQYFPSVSIKAPLHQWDMSHYGLVLDLAKMYLGTSRARLQATTTTTTTKTTETATTMIITNRRWMPLLLIMMGLMCIVNQAASMSLDRLALERNELPAEEPPTDASTVVVDDMKMAAVPANGNTDMYMLVPESVASQLDDTEHVQHNTIDDESDSEAESLPDSPDMLMLESDDTPAMQLVELPSDITIAEEQPEPEAEPLTELPTGSEQLQAEPEADAAVASPEVIEEHVVEQPVSVAEQSAEQIPAQQPAEASQEAQLENAEAMESTGTTEAQVIANDDEEQADNEVAASLPVQNDPVEETADVSAVTDKEMQDDDVMTNPGAAVETEPQEEEHEKQEAEKEVQVETEEEPQAEPESLPKIEEPTEAQLGVAQEEEEATAEEPKPEINKEEDAAVVSEVETTEASVVESMVEGIEEGLDAVISDMLPEKSSAAELEAQPQLQDELPVMQAEDTPANPEDQQTALPEVEVEAVTEQVVNDEVEVLQDPVEETMLVEPVAVMPAESLPETPAESEDLNEAVPAIEIDAQPEEPTQAEVEKESLSENHPEPIAEVQPEPVAEVQPEPVAEVALPEPQAEAEMESQPEPESVPEVSAQQINVEQPVETEKQPEIMQDETVDAPAEPQVQPEAEPSKLEALPEQSMLTTIIPAIVPQPQPIQVLDSVLNYVNASFMQQQPLEQDMPKIEEVEEPVAETASANLRRYDGAQVWRIVVQTDKDKKLADELQSKYDGQLWKEVKQEVDYLLKPQVLAAAERHIRAANLSRIVLIDNLQQVIEQENPPADKIAELQNRKGHRLTWQAYHRLEDIHGFIDYMAKTYPDICSTEIIGYSVEKRPLKILKISNGNPHNPSVWIDGGMHAREWISPAAVTYIANHLLEGWEDHPDHIRNTNWYIHAVANPDGYEYSHTTDRMWRKNMRSHGRQCPGVDLNRNFGYKWGGKGTSASPCSQTYRGSKAFSEPETFYISKFISGFPRETFQAYLSFHSYGQYILYPWGYDYTLTRDRADLDRVARQAGTVITKSTGIKYTVGSSATTLYPAAGGSDDWAKGIAGIKYSYTVEMGDTGRYGFVLPAQFIQPNGKDAVTFADTVARAIAQGRSKDGRSRSRSSSGANSRRHLH